MPRQSRAQKTWPSRVQRKWIALPILIGMFFAVNLEMQNARAFHRNLFPDDVGVFGATQIILESAIGGFMFYIWFVAFSVFAATHSARHPSRGNNRGRIGALIGFTIAHLPVLGPIHGNGDSGLFSMAWMWVIGPVLGVVFAAIGYQIARRGVLAAQVFYELLLRYFGKK